MGIAIGVGNDLAHHQLQRRAFAHGDRSAFSQPGAQAEGDAGRDPAAAIFHQLNQHGTEIEFVILLQVASGSTVMNERVDRFRIGDKWLDLPVAGVFEVSDWTTWTAVPNGATFHDHDGQPILID